MLHGNLLLALAAVAVEDFDQRDDQESLFAWSLAPAFETLTHQALKRQDLAHCAAIARWPRPWRWCKFIYSLRARADATAGVEHLQACRKAPMARHC
jgi:hypothetical protein